MAEKSGQLRLPSSFSEKTFLKSKNGAPVSWAPLTIYSSSNAGLIGFQCQ